MDSDEERKKIEKKDMDDELADAMMQGFKEGGTDHHSNMRTYINNFGVSVKVPGFYIYDALMCPQDHNMILQVIKYSIPFEEDDTIVTHLPDGTQIVNSVAETWQDDMFQGNFSMKLLETK